MKCCPRCGYPGKDPRMQRAGALGGKAKAKNAKRVSIGKSGK